MARELQARHFLVLVIFISFFLLSSTIEARTLHAHQTHHHHAIMKPSGTGSHGDGVTGYYITEVLGHWGTNNSDPILPRRDLSGPSPGDNN
ncbi:hypothetical protein FH972_007448 [Carpinus fangiana]|uniref:Uncharacterized protein n=1 Tax=Carpinus fangiana TaxID=176857 RepID=A0A5N6QVM7_9ROSI|nr:hypothetical protein FH972_007448 [Carpinus fangiana]